MDRFLTAQKLPLRRAFGLFAVAATALVGLGTAYAAGAEQGATNPPRTVTWYADNPQVRAQVELACLDDPGKLSNNPDCLNAYQAGVELALREARSHTAPRGTNNPAFWSSRPESRRSKLLLCRDLPQLDGCEAAKRSLLIEAGRDK